MKKLVFVVVLLLALPIIARGVGEEDSYNSVEYLTNDFKQASLVGLIHPTRVFPDNSFKAMGNVYCTNARVIESFKGNAKARGLIVFYTIFEGKPNRFYREEDRILFLKRVRDEGHARWIFLEMENSSREASKSNLEKMRKISHGSKQNSPNRRSGM